MRPKIVLVILLAAAVVLAVVFVVSKNSHPQPAAATPKPTVAVTPPPAAAPAPAPKPAITAAPAPAPVETNASTNVMLQGEAHDEYVEKQSDQFMDWAMDSDPAEHQKIVAELKNPDRAIRQAALDALEQANDRSVIPQMQQIAGQTTNPSDKKAIQDAIDFIKLPSLTEYLRQHKGQKAAQGNSTAQPQPQNTQTSQ